MERSDIDLLAAQSNRPLVGGDDRVATSAWWQGRHAHIEMTPMQSIATTGGPWDDRPEIHFAPSGWNVLTGTLIHFQAVASNRPAPPGRWSDYHAEQCSGAGFPRV